MKYFKLFVVQLLFSTSIFATTYYVSPSGDDTNSGTSEQLPFQSVQHAIDQMISGDVLKVMDGFYYGAIALKSGITIEAVNPRKAVFTSGELFLEPFSRLVPGGKVYKAPIGDREIQQLYYNNNAMTWAQWPNLQWSENWDASKKWKSAKTGTGPGVLKSDAFSEISGLDLEGGYCFLRYGKGNSCYSREIKSFNGTALHWNDDNFYEKEYTGEDGPRGSEEALLTLSEDHEWHPNKSRFFIAGDLDLLDAPSEWFVEDGYIYFQTPDGRNPIQGKVVINTLAYIIDETEAISYVAFNGVDFTGTSIKIEDEATNISFNDVHFTHIGSTPLFIDRIHGDSINKPITLEGTNINFEKCLFAGAQNSALKLSGSQLSVKDCVFMENNRHANFESRALLMYPSDAYVITENTFFNNCSDAIYIKLKKYVAGGNPEVSYNNIFNAGLYNSDVSGIYMPILSQGYSNIHHNWVHNINGNAIRLDLAGSELSVHHNVLWENGRGLNIEGYFGFNIYNNTAVYDAHGSSVTQNVISHFGEKTDDAAAANDDNFPPITQWNIVNNIVEDFLDRIGPRETDLYDPLTVHNLRKNSKDITVTNRNKVRGNLIGNTSNEFVNGSLNNLNLVPKTSSPPPSTKTVDQIQSQTSALTLANVCCLDNFRGAYAVNDPDPWSAGSSWLPNNLSNPRTMRLSEFMAKDMKNVSLIPSISEVANKSNGKDIAAIIENGSTDEFSVWPNPVKDKFSLRFTQEEPSVSIYIYNTTGTLVYQKQYTNAKSILLDNSVLDQGINILKVFTINKQYTTKVIKD